MKIKYPYAPIYDKSKQHARMTETVFDEKHSGSGKKVLITNTGGWGRGIERIN